MRCCSVKLSHVDVRSMAENICQKWLSLKLIEVKIYLSFSVILHNSDRWSSPVGTHALERRFFFLFRCDAAAKGLPYLILNLLNLDWNYVHYLKAESILKTFNEVLSFWLPPPLLSFVFVRKQQKNSSWKPIKLCWSLLGTSVPFSYFNMKWYFKQKLD